MTTIFSDNFAYENVEIDLDDASIGYKGRCLILTTRSEREFRVTLTDEQLNDLADVLHLNGYTSKTCEEAKLETEEHY